MKTRFNTLDTICIIAELQSLVGMRAVQVYDIDLKTYLIKLNDGNKKKMLLLESGSRIHLTAFDWPKNTIPSGFSMKLRKHLRNKRLESIKQLGGDRIVALQFGSGESAYHVILELFDKGNIILTDHSDTIINLLRPHTEKKDLRFAVREQYPADRAIPRKFGPPTSKDLATYFLTAKKGDNVKKVLLPHLEYGPALLMHVLIMAGFKSNCRYGFELTEDDFTKVSECMEEAEFIIDLASRQVSPGYIIKKIETRADGESVFYLEFHPYLFQQHQTTSYDEFETFNAAVDEYFSKMEGQKIDLKGLHLEKEAMKKVDRIKKDQADRVLELHIKQNHDKRCAELITNNVEMVDAAIFSIRHALASQMDWSSIGNLVEEAVKKNDPVACSIKELRLDRNQITLQLSDPYMDSDEEISELIVNIDLGLSAHSNAKMYYNDKKYAAKKEQKTLESQDKALRSAQKKVKEVVKEVKTMATISKSRKTFWFEKFYWFLSSENFLVIGGRDQQQNEMLVKRYMEANDLYVHADVHGGSSIIIKNPSGQVVPPKSLTEAGIMAVCYSSAWDSKIVCDAWWVHAHQVSKTAPTGEYLTTGSFMIRGHKNFLPPVQLAVGLGILFKLDDASAHRHIEERCAKSTEEAEERKMEETRVKELPVIMNDNEVIPSLSDKEEDESTEVELQEPSVRFNDSEYQAVLNDEESWFDQCCKERGLDAGVNSNKQEVGTEAAVHPDPSEMSASSTTGKGNPESITNKEESFSFDLQHKKNEYVKRGQRGKLKKIKEKYRDQDQEEKELRMLILQSAGSKKFTRKSKKLIEDQSNKSNYQKKAGGPSNKKHGEKLPQEDDFDSRPVNIDLDILNLLTGRPVDEDEFLFALPVIAPYVALNNYKYKVKLTPGSTKRGKIVKTAFEIFLKSKDCHAQEKDVLNNIDDQQISRNFPGKAKLSAPNFIKLKK